MSIFDKTFRLLPRTIFILLWTTYVCSHVSLQAATLKSGPVAVDIGSRQHLGSKYAISTFFVDGSHGGNVGRGGGGGSMVCCVTIPEEWHPNIFADIRWEVVHWSEDKSKTGSEKPVVEQAGVYRAHVPVEKYDAPGDVWVHFFPDGRVRLVISNVGPSNPLHPVRRDDPRAMLQATKGTQVPTLFTESERTQMQKQRAAERRMQGDWR